jgi:transposase
VAAFNAEGVASLRYDRHKGRIPHLTPEQESELAEAIRKGPPPEMKNEVWRGWALRQWAKDRFGVEYCESGIYRLLHRLGFSSLMPRPVHPDSDPAALEEFKKRRCRSSSTSF